MIKINLMEEDFDNFENNLGPSVIPEEGLDDLSFARALLVSAGGVFLLGIFAAVGMAIFGRAILKRLLSR